MKETTTAKPERRPRAEPVDHSQHPLIGVALLAAVLYLAYLLSGSPEIIWTCCKLLGGG